jgi:large subunit ribosomal protein L25
MDLPDSLEVDITELAEPNQHVTVGNIKAPEGVEIDEEAKEVVVASVWEPSALQAANEATGGDAEPGDEAEVEAEEGEDTPQDTQDEEIRPGGKKEAEDKEQGHNPTKK